MSRLIDSPSDGHSETLETMRYLGLFESRAGVRVERLAREISKRWHGADRSGADTDAVPDLLTVLDELHTAGLTQPAVSAAGDLVRLTAAGRIASRSPRPRPVHDPWNRR